MTHVRTRLRPGAATAQTAAAQTAAAQTAAAQTAAAQTAAAQTKSARAKLSAFVITYNREQIIGTCLRALAFADEIVVVDKGSTDGTLAIARSLADRVISVPWSPTVEATRGLAVTRCTHDWILFLDDDECLNAAAVRFLDAELAAPRADIYRLPVRHYVMGLHDERAYYWPEHHMGCFRRGSVAFTDTVHGGISLLSDRVHTVAPDSGACIHNLSHGDVAQFIEKANRYTAQPDRRRARQAGSDIVRFAHERIDHWLSRTDPCATDAYPVAAAVLRSIYDLIDRLKAWEEEAGLDGTALFRAACARLDAEYTTELPALARPRAGAAAMETLSLGAPAPRPSPTRTERLSRAVHALRDSVAAQREAMDAARTDREAARLREAEEHERAEEMRRWAESEVRRAAEFERQLGEFARHHDAALAEHHAAIAAARQACAAECERRGAEIASLAAAASDLHAALSAATDRAAAAEERNRILQASTSWRITAPMRAVLMRLGRR